MPKWFVLWKLVLRHFQPHLTLIIAVWLTLTDNLIFVSIFERVAAIIPTNFSIMWFNFTGKLSNRARCSDHLIYSTDELWSTGLIKIFMMLVVVFKQYLYNTLWLLCFVSNRQVTAVDKRFICSIGFNFFSFSQIKTD